MELFEAEEKKLKKWLKVDNLLGDYLACDSLGNASAEAEDEHVQNNVSPACAVQLAIQAGLSSLTIANQSQRSTKEFIASLANETALSLESISSICSDFGTWHTTQRVVHDAMIDLYATSSMLYLARLLHLPLLINFSTFQRQSHLRIDI